MLRNLFFSLFCFLSAPLFGQPDSKDTSFLAIARKNVIHSFTETLNAHAGLYNGREYDEYKQIADEHPYLYLDWSEGVIEYFGKMHENIPLLYDLSTDEIITEQSSGSKISLLKQKVNYFILKKHRYEYLTVNGLTPGFYDVLYSGSIRVIAKRQKSKREKINGSTMEVFFDEQVKYFLITSKGSSSISNKRSLIKTLAADRPEIKKRLSSEKLLSDKEKAFTGLASLYDQLISAK